MHLLERCLYSFLLIIFLCDLNAQTLPPKEPFPLDVRQIHSGHSLTDPLFGQPWPGQYVELVAFVNNTEGWLIFDDMVGKSTIPGSSMDWRWNNSSGYPDARHNIDTFELLSITEIASLCYEGVDPPQWILDCIDAQREMLSTWVNHAWENGNNGNGAPTLLWSNWVSIDGSDGPFRQMLDTLGWEWENMQDYANDNRLAGAPHVYMIPGHRMMARLYDDVNAGIVPDITDFDEFFSDNIHTNALGDYAIAMIHYACIFNESPVGLPNELINNPPAGTPIPSVELAEYLQTMVWDVVTNYPRTGIFTEGVVASFTATPESGVTPLSVGFDASMSQNFGGDTLTYDWDFDDGNVGSGDSITHVFQNSGEYTVTLIVTNENDDSDTATAVITVTSHLPPEAHISVDTNSGQAPLTVNFDGSGSIDHSGNGLIYTWNFGDGSPEDTGEIVQHTYLVGGTSYTAVLTVSDGDYSSTAGVVIQLTSPPSSGDCVILANEYFDYQTGLSLHGLNGGNGWQGSWRVQNQDTQVPGYQSSNENESLEYLDLQTSGIHGSGGIEWLTAGRRLDTSSDGPFSDFVTAGNPVIGAVTEGDTLWVSALLRKNHNDDEYVYFDLTNSNIPECNSVEHCSEERIGIGYFSTASNVGGERRWSLRLGETVYPTTIPVVLEEESFFAAAIIFNQDNTQVDLFVNPTELGNDGPPASHTISENTSDPYTIRSFTIYFGGQQPNQGAIDEIRFGESYPCVAPDSSVLISLPPVAIIEATPVEGQFPLSVNFNGTQSFHPNGDSLTYFWDFGDGSPGSNADTVSYTYQFGPGQLTATLTVTAPDGQQSSASTVITLLDQNGNFPCLSTITSLQMADCEGEGGHIRVNVEPGVSFTLSQSGDEIPPDPWNEYQDLEVGIYQLEINGDNGCFEEYDIFIQTDSIYCENWQAPACRMDIGVNLPGFADWEPHRAMRNFLKNSRGEAIPFSDECDCWSLDDPGDILAEMAIDSNGYPIGIPQTTSGGTTRLRFFVSSSGRNMVPDETYVFLYDGEGVISLHGTISNEETSPGRIQFELGGDGTLWFQIMESQSTDHIRNIRILRLSDEFEDIVNYPFYEEFLNKIEPFTNLRFMDWKATNNNPIVEWSQRPLPDYYTYGTDMGVPYEIILQLANQTGKDIWLCVPHAANEDYITQMAEFFMNGLNSDINIYLEYSNEVWNWIFTQANYNIENNPLGLMYGRAYAEKAKKVFEIWHDVFQGQECRVKRVVGIQVGFNYLNEHIMAHFDQDDWDYGSPTHYFGLDHGETGVPRLDLLGENATVEDVMENAWNHWMIFKDDMKQDYNNVHIFGKKVITYEGGQHFVGNVFGEEYEYQQAMWDAQLSEEMYDMYIAVHDTIRNWGCRLASQFDLAGTQESIFGSWGALDHIDLQPPFMTTAPKYQALLDLAMEAELSAGECHGCTVPLLSISGLEDCTGTAYSVKFSTNADSLIASAGSITGNTVSSIPLGTDLTLTAHNGLGCETTVYMSSPVSCTASCDLPKLSIGNALCEGVGSSTYMVAFSVYPADAEVNVSAGTLSGNSVSGIPLDSNLIITAESGDYHYAVTVFGPMNCEEVCSGPLISVGKGVLVPDSNDVYTVNFRSFPGAVVSASTGIAGDSSITAIPIGTDVTLTATYFCCEAQTIEVSSPGEINQGDSIVTCPSNMTVCLDDVPFTISGGDPAGGTFSGNGIVSDTIFDPALAGVGIDTITYEYTFANNCTNSCTFEIEVIQTPQVDSLADVITCDSFELPPLTTGNYFTESGGGGAPLFSGDFVTESQTIFIFAETGGIPNCTDETSFELTISPLIGSTTTVTECDSYTWPLNGQTYIMSGTYVEVGSCSQDTLILTITPSTSSTTTVSECDNYTWPLNGETYTMSGTYIEVGTCSQDTLILTITPSTSSTTTASECDSYTWSLNGQTYTMSGTYIEVGTCSQDTLILTITPSTSSTTTVSECDNYTWPLNGETYTISGTYIEVGTCSQDTLILTISPFTSSTTTVSECDSYTWPLNGETYTMSGTYIEVGTCSQDTLTLTITPSTSSTTAVTECDSYTWPVNGQTYTMSGTYIEVGTCSQDTLILTITPSTSSTITVTECDSYTWPLNGQTYTTSGTYIEVGTCSQDTLILTITPSTSSTTTVTECDSYTWPLNGQTYTMSGTYIEVGTCSQDTLVLTIEDVTPPSITCPPTQIIDAEGACAVQIPDFTGLAIVSDDCSDQEDIILSQVPAPGLTAISEITTILLTATDEAGNSSNCTFSLMLENFGETPTLDCGDGLVEVENDAGVCGAEVVIEIDFVEDCEGGQEVVNSFTGGGLNADAFYPVGTAVVEFYLLDNVDTLSQCNVTVIVDDIESPFITCPEDITIETDGGECFATYIPASATATDNCGIASITNNAPPTISAGNTTVVHTATDDSGNTSTCEQTVTVEDNEAPVADCPSDVTISTNAGTCVGSYTPPSFMVSDNCGVESISNDAPADFPPGSTTITYLIEDVNGNTASCQQTVTVEDTEDPVIACPADTTIEIASGETEVFVELPDATAVENCSVASIDNDFNGGADASGMYPVGITSIVFTATDGSGNTATCSTTVTVTIDDEPEQLILSGNIATIFGVNISDVEVEMTGDESGVDITSANGNFEIEVTQGSSVDLTPQKDSDWLDGVTTLDLIIIQQGILFIQPITSPYLLIAADANGDGELSTFDLVLLSSLIVGNMPDIPGNTSWRFIDADFEFDEPFDLTAQNWPEFISLSNVNQDIDSLDFVAIKTGDVSGDAGTGSRMVYDEMELVREWNRTTNEEYEMVIRPGQKLTTTGYQMEFNFNPSMVEEISIILESSELQNLSEHNYFIDAERGIARINWWNASGQELNDQSELFRILIKPRSGVEFGTYFMELMDRGTLWYSEWYDTDANIYRLRLTDSETVAGEYVLHQNRPNPYRDYTSIMFELPEEMEVTLEILDVSGRMIRSTTLQGTRGLNQYHLEVSDLPTGVNYYRLLTDEWSATRTMIKIE